MPRLLALLCVSLCAFRCGLFTPRSPESPTAVSDTFLPATDADIVIENLQNAISEKNSVNYMRCFASASNAGTGFSYTPAASAVTQYGSILSSWSYDEEQTYFQNLIARTASLSNAYSNLTLSNKTSVTSGDSTIQSYTYKFTFENTESGFSSYAVGSMELVLGPDNTNAWVIYRWTDFKTTGDITWSHFRGKFSN